MRPPVHALTKSHHRHLCCSEGVPDPITFLPADTIFSSLHLTWRSVKDDDDLNSRGLLHTNGAGEWRAARYQRLAARRAGNAPSWPWPTRGSSVPSIGCPDTNPPRSWGPATATTSAATSWWIGWHAGWSGWVIGSALNSSLLHLGDNFRDTDFSAL